MSRILPIISSSSGLSSHRYHDDVIKLNYFLRYWPFVRRIHRSPVNSPHKGQWRGTMFSLICAWTKGWVRNGDPGDLRRHPAHDDVTVMTACETPLAETASMSWNLISETHSNKFCSKFTHHLKMIENTSAILPKSSEHYHRDIRRYMCAILSNFGTKFPQVPS